MADLWQFLQSSDPAVARQWVHWHPAQLDECVRARAEHRVATPDAAAMAELRAAHTRWGADDVSLKMLERLADPNVRVVVTGQQPGLLAGPLLVIYKTLASVHWAAELERRHGTPFVPVFWVASEDDDFDEVRRAHWPGAQGQMEEILLDRFDPKLAWKPGKMIGTMPAETLIARFSERIRESAPETEFRADLLARLEEFHGAGASWEDAFCRTFLHLLRGSGVVIVSPLMKWVRQRGAGILRGEIARAGESTRAVIARGEALRESGIEPKLHRRADAVNFFVIDDSQCRHTVRVAGANFETYPPTDEKSETAGGGRKLSADELNAMLNETPERFGFNVVTRPMVQDSILPTVAQIVGPGEAAYLAQVESAYEAFGVFAPVRMPRPQVALVPNSVTKALKKYELSLDQALSLDARALGRIVIERESTEGVAGDLTRMQERQIAELRAWAESVGKNPAVQTSVDKLAQAMTKGFDTLRDRILYSKQEDERHLAGAMIKVENNLRPGGVGQERTLNAVVPFAVNYGWGWAMELMRLMKFEPGHGVQVIELSELETNRNS